MASRVGVRNGICGRYSGRRVSVLGSHGLVDARIITIYSVDSRFFGQKRAKTHARAASGFSARRGDMGDLVRGILMELTSAHGDLSRMIDVMAAPARRLQQTRQPCAWLGRQFSLFYFVLAQSTPYYMPS
jgi:hypothetical protein